MSMLSIIMIVYVPGLVCVQVAFFFLGVSASAQSVTFAAMAEQCKRQFVALSFVFIYLAEQLLAESQVAFGAQDISPQMQEGPFTGDIFTSMLQEFGCKYVLIGHSERRQHHDEMEEVIGQKILAAQQAGLTPILCIGENPLQQNISAVTIELSNQIDSIIAHIGIQGFSNLILAYEPLSAIGSGKPARLDHISRVHTLLYKHIATYSDSIADNLPIVYGGSVKPDNVHALMQQNHVSGVLVGKASLNTDSFMAICKTVLNYSKTPVKDTL